MKLKEFESIVSLTKDVANQSLIEGMVKSRITNENVLALMITLHSFYKNNKVNPSTIDGPAIKQSISFILNEHNLTPNAWSEYDLGNVLNIKYIMNCLVKVEKFQSQVNIEIVFEAYQKLLAATKLQMLAKMHLKTTGATVPIQHLPDEDDDELLF